MDVVLKSNIVLIRTNFRSLKLPWIMDFLEKHNQDTIFLPRAILVLANDQLDQQKSTFLRRISYAYADIHKLPKSFFTRSILKYKNKPVKIEVAAMKYERNAIVDLLCHNPQTVLVKMNVANVWVLSYLRSQLGRYVAEYDDKSILLNLFDMQAKARFEHAIDKESIFHFILKFRYEKDFMQKLYSDFAQFSFNFGDKKRKEEEEKRLSYIDNEHFYEILECPVGASKDTIRESYKKLIRIYHPDRIFSENRDLVSKYTQKFQELQEAYTALKNVS